MLFGSNAGKRVAGLDVNELPLWSMSEPLVKKSDVESVPQRTSVFPFRPDLNNKIALWQGDLWRLKIDAIVNSTNESLNDQSGISGEIFRAAGGQLEDECNGLEGCRTGEAKSTNAYNLPCQRIIHTAGPRFNVKYRTAAENALHSCYRQSLQVLTELGLRSIAFCCINSEKKGYPRESAAHIAIRTVRRFLEHHGDAIELVVLCVNNSLDYECYMKLLPLYCPRSEAEEQHVIDMLPADTGNEYGETVSEERMIRISSLPGADLSVPAEEDEDTARQLLSSFGQMKADPDAQRLSAMVKSKAQLDHEERERMYARYLQRAKAENLSDIERMNILHIGGTDEMGRTVVTLVAHHFPHSSEADYDRLLLYIIRELDTVANRDFIVVYIHTLLDSGRQPPISWVKKTKAMLDYKYRKNLKSLLILHPTLWMKMLFWFLTPFISQKFWEKLVYVDRLQTLHRIVPPELTHVPKFVVEYDAKLWGGESAGPRNDENL